MNITFQQFSENLSGLYEYKLEQDKYIESIPKQFSLFLIDNTYNELLEKQLQLMIDSYFSEYIEDVMYFLQEAMNMKNPCIIVNEKKYEVKELKDFLQYMKENYKFKE